LFSFTNKSVLEMSHKP